MPNTFQEDYAVGKHNEVVVLPLLREFFATSVVLTSNYASIFLLGDTSSTPPVWDMVSFTGILKYTP